MKTKKQKAQKNVPQRKKGRFDHDKYCLDGTQLEN